MKSEVLTVIFLVLVVFAAFEVATDDVKLLVVLSSSMEPLMHPGDLIIAKRTTDFKIGDVVAFQDPSGQKMSLITHRVVEAEGGVFKTKGDAVEETDPFEVRAKDVYGKFIFGLPYLGYFFHEFKNRNIYLYVSFILIPAAILIINEFRNLLKDERTVKREEKLKNIFRKREKKGIRMKILLFVAVSTFLATCILFNPSMEVTGDEIVNKGIFEVIVFGGDLPYYHIVKPGESLRVKGDYFAINHVLPLIWLYPLYKLNLLWTIPLLTTLVTLYILKPVLIYKFHTKKFINRKLKW
jgi:signal peptidase